MIILVSLVRSDRSDCEYECSEMVEVIIDISFAKVSGFDLKNRLTARTEGEMIAFILDFSPVYCQLS
jgi:hypothetical protein